MSTANRIEVRIEHKEVITEQITRYRFVAVSGEPLPGWSAGANIEVDITAEITRAYSLCNAPSDQAPYYEIAVKREDNGRGGSLTFHQQAEVGSVYTISAPQNYFALADQGYAVLVGGGIGVTPLLSMAHQLTAQGRPFTLIVCTQKDAPMPFTAELVASKWPVIHYDGGREHLNFLSQLPCLDDDSHVYCCGPNDMMKNVKSYFALPESQWHQEQFSPSEEINNEQELTLYLSQSDKQISVSKGQSMLQALRSNGLEIETVCEQGVCGSCLVEWRDGEPEHLDQCLDDEDRAQYLALCCARCHSKSLTLEL